MKKVNVGVLKLKRSRSTGRNVNIINAFLSKNDNTDALSFPYKKI